MIEIRQTETFKAWLESLPDKIGKGRIVSRIVRAQAGNFGDHKSVGVGVSEMRLDFGPGYRLYFTRRGGALVILLAGGTKDTQTKDIKTAQAMAQELNI